MLCAFFLLVVISGFVNVYSAESNFYAAINNEQEEITLNKQQLYNLYKQKSAIHKHIMYSTLDHVCSSVLGILALAPFIKGEWSAAQKYHAHLTPAFYIECAFATIFTLQGSYAVYRTIKNSASLRQVQRELRLIKYFEEV